MSSAALPRSVVSKPLGQYKLANDNAGTVLIYIQPTNWPSGAIRDRIYACEAGAHETEPHQMGGKKWIFVRCSACGDVFGGMSTYSIPKWHKH